MIVFLGDSFTWGQGLYSKKWIKEGKTIEYCNNNMPPRFSHENISYSDDVYRKEHHFPNLVAKHYDRSYYVKPKNGGSNLDILNIVKDIDSLAQEDSFDFVVIQFTDFPRSLAYNYRISYDITDFDEFTYKECSSQVKQIYDILKNKSNIKHFLFFSWKPDIGKIIKESYNKHYIPLFYKEKEYECFETMTHKYPELELAGDIGVLDGHFSELGHRVIADSIIKKVDTMNINFKRPK